MEKKIDWTNTPDVSSFDEHPLRPTNNFPSRSGPLAYFEVFFDAEDILNLVNQTNLFATQKNASCSNYRKRNKSLYRNGDIDGYTQITLHRRLLVE